MRVATFAMPTGALRDFDGISIALAIHPLDKSLSILLITRYPLV